MTKIENKRILITGARGFLGQHVVKAFLKKGVPESQIIAASSSEADLRNREEAHALIQELAPDVVISLAARLGGIGDNRSHPADYFYDNLMIGINTIEACRTNGVEKLVNIGTVCSYPKIVDVPFREEDLWNGYPEETNAPYGIAKKSVVEYGRAVYNQHGFQNVNLLLTNLYGPGDDFREETSHVIPAIIKKTLRAKEKGESRITAWGDGSPSRDFLYVEDAADAIILAAENYNEPQPINVGSGQEVSIRHLIERIKQELGFKGDIFWDTSRPNGQPRRILDTSKAEKYFGFRAKTNFDVGLRRTIDWYLRNRKEIDSLKPKFAK